MKPIEFKNQNSTPLIEDGTKAGAFNEGGKVITCWRMSLQERLMVLITGKIWVYLSNIKGRPPADLKIKLLVDCPITNR